MIHGKILPKSLILSFELYNGVDDEFVKSILTIFLRLLVGNKLGLRIIITDTVPENGFSNLTRKY
jgi:hypothetical protein